MRPALLASLLLAACSPAQVIVVMNSENNSGQNGTATLTDLGGKTGIVVRIKRSEFGESQPIHLHTGRCGEIGVRADLKNKTLGLSDVRPTDGGLAGTDAELEIPLKDLTTGDWVINVHDALDFSLYVSCGNIN